MKLALLALLLALPTCGFAIDEPSGASPAIPPANSKPKSAKRTIDEVLKDTSIAPLDIPKASISEKEFEAKLHEWVRKVAWPVLERELGEQFKDEAKKGAMEKVVKWWSGSSSPVDLKKLADEVSRIGDAGLAAPMFQFFAAELLIDDDRKDEALARWDIAAAEDDAGKIPAWASFVAAVRLVYYDEHPGIEYIQRVFERLQAAIRPENCSEADARYLLHVILNTASGVMESQPEQFVATFTGSTMPEWARLVCIGECEVHLAWKARGSGWASSVSKEGWQKFREHLGKAREALTKSWELHPESPEAATRMITVAMGGQAAKGETARTWLDRAIAAEFDHMDAYSRMINALLPRWGGSHGQILELGIAAAKAERFDSRLPEVLQSALSAIANEVPDSGKLFRNPAISSLLLKARREQLRIANDETEKASLRGLLAIEAWTAGDHGAAAEAFDGLEQGPGKVPILPERAQQLAETRDIDWVSAADESRFMASKGSGDFRRATEALESNRFDDAKSIADQLLKDPEAAKLEWIAALPERIQFERDYGKGKWLKIPLRRGEWANRGFAWEAKESDLTCDNAGQGPSYRLIRSSLGPRFEMRGKARLEKKEDAKRSAFGVAVGHAGESGVDGETDFWLWTEDGTATTVMIGSEQPGGEEPASKTGSGPELGEDGSVNFRIRVYDGKISVWIGDKAVFERVDLPERFNDGSQGVGLIALGEEGAVPVRFKEIEVRRLGDAL